MRIRTKELQRKLAPKNQDFRKQIHHYELLAKEEWRRLAWKRDVIASCDNVDELFPEDGKGVDWTDERQVKFPKKWRVPKQVFNQQWERYICFHAVRQGKHWKIARLKRNGKNYVTHLYLRKGKE